MFNRNLGRVVKVVPKMASISVIKPKDYLNIFGKGWVSLASMPLVTSLASTVMSALISCSTKLDVSVTFTGLPSLRDE